MAYFNNSDKDALNATLAEETRKLKIAYCKIGKLYADTCTEPSGEYAQLINAVRASQKNIISIRKQLAAEENVKTCVNCGASVSKESSFCTACGKPADKKEEPAPVAPVAPVAPAAPVAPVAPSTTATCPACGRSVENGVKFCTFCGSPMNAPAAAPQAISFDEAFAAPAEPVSNKCPTCSSEYADDDIFCINCGTKLR